jgi:LysM repeat protein
MQLNRFLLMLTLLASQWLQAQNSDVVDYINTYKELAIREMQRSGVPASITLAQGIHETMAGKSVLVIKSNNHFGIKCKTSWTGDKVYHDDDARGECFRSYPSATESYADHSDFLKNSSRYSFLFQIAPTDYKEWAYGLKKAGYATNNRYPQILIKLVEDYNLNEYTLIAMGAGKPQDEVLAGANKTLHAEVALVNEPAVAPQYPAGEFRINDTKVVFVKSGTSLLSVAAQYDISLGRLLDFNDMKREDVVIEDQLLFLQRKRKTGANEFHVVQKGESLYAICQAEGLRFESLLKYNHLQGNQQPATGEKLYLQQQAPARPRLAEEVSYKN